MKNRIYRESMIYRWGCYPKTPKRVRVRLHALHLPQPFLDLARCQLWVWPSKHAGCFSWENARSYCQNRGFTVKFVWLYCQFSGFSVNFAVLLSNLWSCHEHMSVYHTHVWFYKMVHHPKRVVEFTQQIGFTYPARLRFNQVKWVICLLFPKHTAVCINGKQRICSKGKFAHLFWLSHFLVW